jgi:Protein of unknown function (DUF1553)/Protein of unknown function (DUF1549)
LDRYLLRLSMLVGIAVAQPDQRAAADPLHWAFTPPQRPTAPMVRDEQKMRTPIDRFVQAALERRGLSMGLSADRATLLRRVSFDLTGLPPTLAEIALFQNDATPAAYERMVERYLASPHYGERWGKYWLDAAGYADSNGYFNADSDRPLAYRYRDYVIRSFNNDKPYDRFVMEQLAGDELASYSPNSDIVGETLELLTATHFLRNAPDGTAESDGNPDEVRIDRYTVLEGNLQNTMNCFLGLTIQCARCHAHKFEPIRHEDYYALQAILLPAYNPERWMTPNERVVHVGTRAAREDHQKRTEKAERQIRALEAGLRTMAEPLMEQVFETRLQKLEPKQRDAILAAFRMPKDKRTAAEEALLKQHGRELTIKDEELAKQFLEFGAIRTEVQKAIELHRQELPPPLGKVAILADTDPKTPAHHVLLRGVHNNPGPEVPPGVVAALDPRHTFQVITPASGMPSTGRRTALARWVTAPENPLFARVMVNRIWQHHFGAGLVATPDNLGQSGAKPTHPELLDFLATEFVRSDWSIKAMHRLIMNSAVYRQAGTVRDDAFAADPENVLLWRFPLRRLDAEGVRDAMLSAAGELDQRMSGPYVPTVRAKEGSVVVDETRADARRRSVYLQQRRTQVATLLELFDAPSMVSTCGQRTPSTIPLQSLALLNSDFARARSKAFAGRLLQEPNAGDLRRIERAFELACGRLPLPAEQTASTRFITEQRKVYAQDWQCELLTWTDFCQMLMASNAFLYVE